MNKRHSFLWVMMLTGLVLVPVACSSAPSSSTSATPTIDSAHLTAFAQEQPTPAPSPSPTPTPPPLGIVPQDCPPGPAPQFVYSGVGPGIGAPPVWAIGFDGSHATLHIGNPQGNTYTQYGWERKVLWVIGPNYTHSVTLHGGSLRNGTRLWFQFGDQAPTMTPALEPQHPGTITGSDVGWAGFPSYLLIPRADCYYLEAQWPGGSWRISFAAGL